VSTISLPDYVLNCEISACQLFSFLYDLLLKFGILWKTAKIGYFHQDFAKKKKSHLEIFKSPLH